MIRNQGIDATLVRIMQNSYSEYRNSYHVFATFAVAYAEKTRPRLTPS